MSYLKSAPSNLSNLQISRKSTALTWEKKYLTCLFLSWNFKNVIAIFEISILKFVKLQNFSKKKKKKKEHCLNCWAVFFGYFSPRITKKSWNQHPQIFETEKLHKKPKMSNFLTKNFWWFLFDQESLIWVFSGKNILGNYCHIWKQHPPICQVAKLC